MDHPIVCFWIGIIPLLSAPDIRSRCFAFAPPAMFSRNLSPRAASDTAARCLNVVFMVITCCVNTNLR